VQFIKKRDKPYTRQKSKYPLFKVVGKDKERLVTRCYISEILIRD